MGKLIFFYPYLQIQILIYVSFCCTFQTRKKNGNQKNKIQNVFFFYLFFFCCCDVSSSFSYLYLLIHFYYIYGVCCFYVQFLKEIWIQTLILIQLDENDDDVNGQGKVISFPDSQKNIKNSFLFRLHRSKLMNDL